MLTELLDSFVGEYDMTQRDSLSCGVIFAVQQMAVVTDQLCLSLIFLP